MWSRDIKDKALVACGRRCCICHRFCGTKIELHHIIPESKGGEFSLENCIPLCFDCHAEVGHYNPLHPRGTKYTTIELRGHRDRWFSAMAEPGKPQEVFEDQLVILTGLILQETFPGRPNFESLETDEAEICWILNIPTPVTLIWSWEGNDFEKIEGIKKLHMILTDEQYEQFENSISTEVTVSGRLIPSHTAHHHGDALIEVVSLEPISKKEGQ
jgi:hypothetical protein